MPSTPWTSQRSKGQLTSDRIPGQSGSASKGVSQAKQKQSPSKPQSPEVTRLQKLISYLQNPPPPSKAESEGGCFCLGQIHKISPYAALCMSCGLILCELNQPYRTCPFKSCDQPLLSAQARAALIASLNEKVALTIVEEENLRRKQEEDRKRAAGAFPELAPSHVPTKSAPAVPHKVLSLTQKGAVLTTTRKIMAPPSPRPSRVDMTEPVIRVPQPPQEPVRYPPRDLEGTWESLRSVRMVYVPSPQAERRKAGGSKKSKKARQKQGQVEADNTIPEE